MNTTNIYCLFYFILCRSICLSLSISNFVTPLEIQNVYFGKHDKGDKSYKFMLQVAYFHRQLIFIVRRMKISYQKLAVANFHRVAKIYDTGRHILIKRSLSMILSYHKHSVALKLSIYATIVHIFNKYKQNTDKAIANIVLKVTSRSILSENYGSPSWTEITLRYVYKLCA